MEPRFFKLAACTFIDAAATFHDAVVKAGARTCAVAVDHRAR
jgi:hypothetical protein